MGTKHDVLVESEIMTAKINIDLENTIEQFKVKNPHLKNKDINILDWGCGRGKTVFLLRKMGFNAFGIEIDKNTMLNGYSLFQSHNMVPNNILLLIDQLEKFNNNFFHIIFSEQVVEHLKNIEFFIEEHNRLLKKGGFGLHIYPGSKSFIEPHLRLPIVHWIPKNKLRKFLIGFFRIFIDRPDIAKWPGLENKSFWEKCEVFYQYLLEKTYYRDVSFIKKLFKEKGFETINEVITLKKIPFVKKKWLDNGFPKSDIKIFCTKK